MNKYYFGIMISVTLSIALNLTRAAATDAPHQPPHQPPHSPLVRAHYPAVMQNADGTQHHLSLYTATTKPQRQSGFRGVMELARDRGMLFAWPTPLRPVMEMVGTYLSLEMLFLDKTGRVTEISPALDAGSNQRYRPKKAISFVLELNKGTTKALNIKVGSRLIFSGHTAPNNLLPLRSHPDPAGKKSAPKQPPQKVTRRNTPDHHG